MSCVARYMTAAELMWGVGEYKNETIFPGDIETKGWKMAARLRYLHMDLLGHTLRYSAYNCLLYNILLACFMILHGSYHEKNF